MDRSLFYERTDAPVNAVEVNDMISEIFALANDQEGVDAAELWSMDKWYCMECMDGIFQRHFWKWILARQRKGVLSIWFIAYSMNVQWTRLFLKEGEPMKPDCEHGYVCQRLTPRDGEHAQKYNVSMSLLLYAGSRLMRLFVPQHLCTPINDDNFRHGWKT